MYIENTLKAARIGGLTDLTEQLEATQYQFMYEKASALRAFLKEGIDPFVPLIETKRLLIYACPPNGRDTLDSVVEFPCGAVPAEEIKARRHWHCAPGYEMTLEQPRNM